MTATPSIAPIIIRDVNCGTNLNVKVTDKIVRADDEMIESCPAREEFRLVSPFVAATQVKSAAWDRKAVSASSSGELVFRKDL